jgi:hypothetical protein
MLVEGDLGESDADASVEDLKKSKGRGRRRRRGERKGKRTDRGESDQRPATTTERTVRQESEAPGCS